MIPVICVTNIDSFKHVQWPAELLGIPNKGDNIRAVKPATIRVKRANGLIEPVKIDHPTLRVVGVTHVTGNGGIGLAHVGAYLMVELHDEHAYELGWIY